VTLQKGPDYFVEAARRVLAVDPHVKFVMAGTGDLLPRMVERSAEAGIGERMVFTGFVDRDQAMRLFRRADLFVMPSVSEPFGIVPLEAMDQGAPVILSRQSGVAEVVRHAIKVDFWDVEDLASKILAALAYPALAGELRRNGREESARLNWGEVSMHVLDVYDELTRKVA
jgi:glycosyltransferase involved in cell wall biosynthesis